MPVVFKRTLQTAFYELQAPSWALTSVVKDVQSFWGLKLKSKNDLIHTGRDMARLNAAYELALQENAMLKHEVGALEQLFNLPPTEGYRYEVARVARRDINTWWHRLTLRKGRKHGIPKGAGVVFKGGVVGRVVEVYEYTSAVELISSPNFRIAGHLQNDLRPVTYQGLGSPVGQTGLGRVSQVPLDGVGHDDKKSQQLVTSRLGGIFPEGITIGYVAGLSCGTDGLFAQGEVVLDRGLSQLQEVAVLIPIESDHEA